MIVIAHLKDIWDYFAARMTEIELYRHAAEITAKNELELIDKKEKIFNNAPEPKYLSDTLYNMAFEDATTGGLVVYDHRELNFADQRLRMILHKNKQYQWLLVEAYEEFEAYLEKVYAFCGAKDNSLWPLKDYGNITLPELSEKDFDWYVSQAKSKKEKPHSILNHFRKQFPDLSNMEITNHLNVNLKLTIFMIERMRHFIVHRNGVVNNKNDFIEKVTSKAGFGNITTEHSNYLKLYFGTGDYQDLILLLELPVSSEIPIHHNRLNGLIKRLMAYAHLLYQYVNNAEAT